MRRSRPPTLRDVLEMATWANWCGDKDYAMKCLYYVIHHAVKDRYVEAEVSTNKEKGHASQN